MSAVGVLEQLSVSFIRFVSLSTNFPVDRREKITRTLWFWVLVVTVVCPSHVFCQDPHDYVPNLPYTAQVVGTGYERSADGTRVRYEDKFVWMRDSYGRTRIEVFGSNCYNRGKPDVVNLYIPLRRQFIQLFPGSKTASVQTWGTGPIITQSQNIGRTTTESLGGRLINGIYAEGARFTKVIPFDGGRGPDIVDVEEKWVSPDLKVIVLDKGTSSRNSSEETTTEIREVDRSEPDASLFEIPADYKIRTVDRR